MLGGEFQSWRLMSNSFILFPWILASELWICLEGSTCNKRWRASHDDEHRNALCSEDAKCQRTSPCATRCHFPLWNRRTISQCVPAGKCCCLPSQGVLLDSSVLCAKGWREGRPTPSSIKMYQGNTQKQTLMFLVIFWLTQSSLRDDPGPETIDLCDTKGCILEDDHRFASDQVGAQRAANKSSTTHSHHSHHSHRSHHSNRIKQHGSWSQIGWIWPACAQVLYCIGISLGAPRTVQLEARRGYSTTGRMNVHNLLNMY